MRASLISARGHRGLIELMVHAHDFDAFVCIVGCDKTVPAALMALARVDKPASSSTAGRCAPAACASTRDDPGRVGGGRGIRARHTPRAELDALERQACPGPGTCAGHFTANTMAVALDCLGIAASGDGSIRRRDAEEKAGGGRARRPPRHLARTGPTARTFLDRRALINAMVGITATGGSSNGRAPPARHRRRGRHRARARRAHRGRRADAGDREPRSVGPMGGRDLHRAGGAGAVIAELIRAGRFDGDAPAVAGGTLAEATAHAPAPDGEVVFARRRAPSSRAGGCSRCAATSRRRAASSSSPAPRGMRQTGPARVFDGEEACAAAVRAGDVRPGDVLVIRVRGTGRRARHARDAERHVLCRRRGPRRSVALVTDGRFSGATRGLMVGHVAPEAARGRPARGLARRRLITIDSRLARSTWPDRRGDRRTARRLDSACTAYRSASSRATAPRRIRLGGRRARRLTAEPSERPGRGPGLTEHLHASGYAPPAAVAMKQLPPAKQHAVTLIAGTCTRPEGSPAGLKRRTSEPPYRATQRRPRRPPPGRRGPVAAGIVAKARRSDGAPTHAGSRTRRPAASASRCSTSAGRWHPSRCRWTVSSPVSTVCSAAVRVVAVQRALRPVSCPPPIVPIQNRPVGIAGAVVAAHPRSRVGKVDEAPHRAAVHIDRGHRSASATRTVPALPRRRGADLRPARDLRSPTCSRPGPRCRPTAAAARAASQRGSFAEPGRDPLPTGSAFRTTSPASFAKRLATLRRS